MPEHIPAFLAETFEPLHLEARTPPSTQNWSSGRIGMTPFDASIEGPSFDIGPDDEGPVGGFVRPEKRLPLQMAIQEHSQWCWAAVSVSVADYLGSDSLTQCSLATQVKNVDCCGGYTEECNEGEVLSKPLKALGIYNGFRQIALPYGQVKTSIEADLPICCFIDWNDGSGIGHFVVVGGWLEGETGTVYVDVFDPSDGAVRQVVYNEFVQKGYRAGGSWTDSYLVTKPAGTV